VSGEITAKSVLDAQANLRRIKEQDIGRETKQRILERRMDRDTRANPDALRVAINAPHSAQVRGNNIALYIKPSEESAQSNVAATQPRFPFRIVSLGSGKIGVWPESYLFSTVVGNDTIAVDGLLTGTNPTSSDTNAFAIPNIGDKIWLKIASDLTSATITYGATTGHWDSYPDPNEIDNSDPDNPFQTYYHLLLAEIVDATAESRPISFSLTVSTEKRGVVQMFNRNVIATSWAIDGVICTVPETPTLLYPATV
jgi:hypothetical protein